MEPRRSAGFPPGASSAWRAATPVARFLFHRFFPLTVEGTARIPEGPVVVAANHYSHLDPVVVGIAVDRLVRYLAVDELYGHSAFFDNLTLWLGAIPMTRTRVPLGPLRTALAELESGGSVGLFPEGVRVWTWGEVDPPKRGAAWLARRAGVPLVPVAIAGSDQALGRGTTRVARRPIHAEVCAPLFPEEYDEADDALSAMMAVWQERIGAALAAAYRR